MVSLKHKSKGFTIVELLIVIVVIGILATLVIVTFTGIKEKARDSKRKNDINAIAAALETYNSDKNTYPTLAHLTDGAWVTSHMKGFKPEALTDPKAKTLALVNGSTASDTQYAYSVTPAGCDDADDTTTPCTNYTISAKLEADGKQFSQQSNN